MTLPNKGQDQTEVKKKTPQDFIFGKVIGEGSFSTVYLAKDVQTNMEFAIKILEKTHIIREKKTEYVMREKEVLRILGSSCRYFVHLYSTFQDVERLYFVLSYAKNGELLKHIILHKKFSFDCTRYYAAELVLALEYLNSKNIVHRDLKPENILFDNNFHILITDFGSAKIEKKSEIQANGDTDHSVQGPRRRRNSFVGTAQFVSPEMLQESKSSFASDLWALGCIVYQMASGKMPFTGGSEYLIFQKIIKLEYQFPEDFDDTIKDFVEKLLVLEPNRRLGASDSIPYTSLRAHKMFEGINWNDLGPPPKLSSDTSTLIKSQDSSPDISENLEPGLDNQKVSRLVLKDMLPEVIDAKSKTERKKSEANRKITEVSQEELEKRLQAQRSNPFSVFVEGNLILKQGLIDKKKGLFPRRRMFLLTLGPHLYYADPVTMTFKGEVPFSADLRTEAKNFKTFFIHTPNRKYYLEDPEGYALEWCNAIDQVKEHYFPSGQVPKENSIQ
ncbi:3-phosphoinositide-dependent protein kinase 1 [Anthonomus grandis grandis]|uniref:3-phosphoinositide-dependent protein kinase 1 n=1 Tax=Anthonomus grandis grandis TaxID=2921223 RepID=UPI0021666C95|nr:3-phosphoinositide-dependent protein kinase 1 [Anthonomus grandis grandis]XP_050301385.1 3-phosphoinositide-dependent protein kinase 1 [Anthonomus grandis grandis]XP_050301386.1 3-phosphoinositide-dependent protein kinase 1 [Anthonomus grandis grandis]